MAHQRKPAKRTPYETLGLSPEATDDDIKRSFRRLALKLHPDKQTGTDEERALSERRFKEVNEAYSVLSDPARREFFDKTGKMDDDDDDEPSHGGGGRRRRGSGGGDDEPIYMSVDELISLTFGTRRRRMTILTEEPLLMLLIQVLPMLLMVYASLSVPSERMPSYADVTSAPFRMSADAAYSHERRTAAESIGASITYYVRADMQKLVQSNAYSLALIEDAVKSLDRERQRAECDAQLRQKQLGANEARRTPKGPEREARVRAAEARTTPACAALLSKYAETRSASEAFKTAKAASEGGEGAPRGQLWRAKTAAERAAKAGSVKWTTTTSVEPATVTMASQQAGRTPTAKGAAAAAAA